MEQSVWTTLLKTNQYPFQFRLRKKKKKEKRYSELMMSSFPKVTEIRAYLSESLCVREHSCVRTEASSCLESELSQQNPRKLQCLWVSRGSEYGQRQHSWAACICILMWQKGITQLSLKAAGLVEWGDTFLVIYSAHYKEQLYERGPTKVTECNREDPLSLTMDKQ